VRAPTRHMLWLEGRAREGAQEATDASETVVEPERAESPPQRGGGSGGRTEVVVEGSVREARIAVINGRTICTLT
jgi:hypothetical protein